MFSTLTPIRVYICSAFTKGKTLVQVQFSDFGLGIHTVLRSHRIITLFTLGIWAMGCLSSIWWSNWWKLRLWEILFGRHSSRAAASVPVTQVQSWMRILTLQSLYVFPVIAWSFFFRELRLPEHPWARFNPDLQCCLYPILPMATWWSDFLLYLTCRLVG